jgi:glycosyltransferase involved in cell wall biosynthesis
MFYIIPNYYEPNTAATNRFLALLKGLSAKFNAEKSCEVEFFLPNKKRDKIEDSYSNVSVNYWWDKPLYFKNRYLKYISFVLAVKSFIRRLKIGDSVLLLGHVELLPIIQKKKGIRVYLEMNEFPEIFEFGNGLIKISNEQLLESCKKLDGLFVISSSLKEYFSKKGVPVDKIYLYKMIVDPLRFESLKKTNYEQRYIAYCGTASNSKDGVDVLIRSFAIVAKKHPEVKLFIVGQTPSLKDVSGNLALIDELGVGGQIVFTGIITATDMPQLLKNAEVLVLARPDNIQAKYGFPTKLGEYLLTGNPVVVTAVGDIPLYLKDDDNALLAQPNNPTSIAEKIEWALNNNASAKNIGLHGRETALKCFNPFTEAEKILQIIFSNKNDCTKSI